MQYCEACKVYIRGERRHCPLCQGPLSGGGDEREEPFPLLAMPPRPYHLFWRLLLFLSAAAAVICGAINVLLWQGGPWSLYVLAGLGSMWLSLGIALNKRGSPTKGLLWQVAILSSLAALWDLCTGWHGWSLDYVVPTLCVFAMLALALLAKLLHLRVEDYMIYLVIDALFGIVPLLFLLLGWLRVFYPSVICVAVSLLSLCALLLFEGERMRMEVKKRLHL